MRRHHTNIIDLNIPPKQITRWYSVVKEPGRGKVIVERYYGHEKNKEEYQIHYKNKARTKDRRAKQCID